MEKTYNINGTSYTVNELIAIMREQLPGLKKYSQDKGEDMMVKIGPEETIYWDWTGQVMD